MSIYTFDDPSSDTDSSPDWKVPVALETGVYTARLTRTSVKANTEKGTLAVLAEFSVEIPGEADPVTHEEWLTTHRPLKDERGATRVDSSGRPIPGPTKMIQMTLKNIGAIAGIEPKQALNGLVVASNHARFNELLSTRIDRVFELTFKRSADGQYLNLNKIVEQ